MKDKKEAPSNKARYTVASKNPEWEAKVKKEGNSMTETRRVDGKYSKKVTEAKKQAKARAAKKKMPAKKKSKGKK
tara:strand:+ start:256 stop:480 length:225 start_codon:yes stop_codon:yes gene_type:complete